MTELRDSHHIHVVGAGGAGMSALAKILHQMGHEVSGSDLKDSVYLDNLRNLGIDVWAGSRPDKAPEWDLVVASSAVPEHDGEVEAAVARSVPVWRRPELLGALTSTTPALGATGTHGKTTTTALIVAALRGIGEDPSFIVGGRLADLNTNAHLGNRDLFVLEADEAFGTFLELTMAGLVVTNVEADHLDHYGTVYELEDAFAQAVRAVQGPAVLCGDDAGARRVAERTGRPTYGTGADNRWRLTDLEQSNSDVRFDLHGTSAGTIPVRIGQPAQHWARNAAGALILLDETGHDVSGAADALADYAGVRRRFERRGEIAGMTIVDDYAHHPTEVAATLRAARSMAARRLVAVFQPHLYSRTAEMHREFGLALASADLIVVTDVFGAREAPVPGVTGRLVAESAASHGALVEYVEHRAELAARVAELGRDRDLVVTMGAGDITTLADELAAELSRQES